MILYYLIINFVIFFMKIKLKGGIFSAQLKKQVTVINMIL